MEDVIDSPSKVVLPPAVIRLEAQAAAFGVAGSPVPPEPRGGGRQPGGYPRSREFLADHDPSYLDEDPWDDTDVF